MSVSKIKNTLFRNVSLTTREGAFTGTLHDMAVTDGHIASLAPAGTLASDGYDVIEGHGRLLTPPFVDGHTHLDKTMLSDGREFPGLKDAIAEFNVYCDRGPTKAEVMDRARRMLTLSLRHGSLFVRSHSTLWGPASLVLLEALTAIKEEFAPVLDVQIIAMVPCYGEPLSAQTLEAMHTAAKNFPLTGFGCAAHMSSDPENVVDTLMTIAGEHNLLVDFHVDENDRPDITSLKRICSVMEREPHWQGKVTAGHICALSNVPHPEAEEVMARMATVNLHAITMPSCNLYLMGRADRSPVRRGITRVQELVDAGVNVACASDNVRDYFRPFGNADVLEEALITAQVAQMGTPSALEKVFRMATYNGAKLMRLEGYGLEPGCKADLVLLDAKSPMDALLSQAEKAVVMKSGQVVCRNLRSTEWAAFQPK